MNKATPEMRLTYMNKQVFLALFALLLAAIYVVFFTDLTAKRKIQINYGNLRSVSDNPAPGVFFQLDRPYKLTSVKVVLSAEAATNKAPHPLWYLVSKNPTNVASFAYGHAIPGMTPFFAKDQAKQLQPGEQYRLIVQDSRKVRGEINFEVH